MLRILRRYNGCLFSCCTGIANYYKNQGIMDIMRCSQCQIGIPSEPVSISPLLEYAILEQH